MKEEENFDNNNEKTIPDSPAPRSNNLTTSSLFLASISKVFSKDLLYWSSALSMFEEEHKPICKDQIQK